MSIRQIGKHWEWSELEKEIVQDKWLKQNTFPYTHKILHYDPQAEFVKACFESKESLNGIKYTKLKQLKKELNEFNIIVSHCLSRVEQMINKCQVFNEVE